MGYILLVEDNLNTAEMMIRLMTSVGHEVRHEGTGLDGMRAARERRPDIVLMDFNLPDIDGTNIVLVLKKQLGGVKAPPVIAVTARSGDREESYAKRMGCDACVSKPIDPEAFLELINHFLKKTKQQV
jgi:DNA-binding response OmpR family regulator